LPFLIKVIREKTDLIVIVMLSKKSGCLSENNLFRGKRKSGTGSTGKERRAGFFLFLIVFAFLGFVGGQMFATIVLKATANGVFADARYTAREQGCCQDQNKQYVTQCFHLYKIK
jgi:hypothetical protein